MRTIDVGYTVVGGVLGCAMLFLLVPALIARLLRRVRSVSKHVDVPVVVPAKYPIEIWLTIRKREKVTKLRSQVAAGIVHENLPEEQKNLDAN